MTNVAETILRDVKLYEPDWTKEPYDRSEMVESTVGDWLSRDEVLAALTAAIDPALSERAALTVLRLRSGLDNADRGADGERELGGVVLTMNDAADLITALLARVVGLTEEIKRLTEVIDSTADYLEENHQSQGKPYRWLRAAITEAGYE